VQRCRWRGAHDVTGATRYYRRTLRENDDRYRRVLFDGRQPPAVTLRNDTLFVVWEKAGDFRGDSRVSTWIMGIAYRRGLNLLRAEYRAHERMVLATTEEQQLRDPLAKQSDLAELLECA
jgi:DNA-directed RNA polymerase specialized sigma24 family protein